MSGAGPRISHLSTLHTSVGHWASDSMSGSESLHAGSALAVTTDTISYLILLAFGNLPTALRYFSISCRVLAFVIAAPFALCIALDLIAYGIARTLHLSLSPRRVPRSPSASSYHLSSPHHLLDEVHSDILLDDASTSEGDQSDDSSMSGDKTNMDGSRRVSVASSLTENTSQYSHTGALALDGIVETKGRTDWDKGHPTVLSDKALDPYPSPSPSPEHMPRLRLDRQDR